MVEKEAEKKKKAAEAETAEVCDAGADVADGADEMNEATGDGEQKKKSSLRKEFLEFINRGSVVDLAVGVAVGGAFTAIVNSLVNDLVMPLVGLLMGGVDLSNLALTVPGLWRNSEGIVIRYGNFLQNIVEFLIVAWVIFMIIKAMNRLRRRRDAIVKKTKKA